MIKNFRHKGLKKLYETGDGKLLNPRHIEKIENILGLLDTAENIESLNVHGLWLHALTGNLKGFWSVTVRANWRIIFRFENGKALDVDLVDYH